MSIGSYIRNKALNDIVHQFLRFGDISSKKQIVSLGAGFDTRYFLLKVGLISGCWKNCSATFHNDIEHNSRQEKYHSMKPNLNISKSIFQK